MRGALLRNSRGGEKHFRWRGTDISRIENLSDAVGSRFGRRIDATVKPPPPPAAAD